MYDIREKTITCAKCKEFGLDYMKAKQENYDFAYNYVLKPVKLLWIIESPPLPKPNSNPRYFYRPELSEIDILYRQIMFVLGIPISDPKDESLIEFMNRGHFLIDAAKCPVNGPNKKYKSRMLHNCKEILQMEVKHLDPEKIIIIKWDIFNHIYSNVKCAGLEDRVINKVPLPFPNSKDLDKFPNAVLKYL